MNTVKAICKCKELSESDPIIAVRQKPLENWGVFTWIFTILLMLITAGGWIPFVVGWVLGWYWLNPTYRCQFCKAEVEKNQFRV